MSDPERFLTAQVKGETYLLDQSSGRFYKLGGSGAMLWSDLAAGWSVYESSTRIAARTGTPIEQVLQDMRRFAQELIELGLLEAQAVEWGPEVHPETEASS